MAKKFVFKIDGYRSLDDIAVFSDVLTVEVDDTGLGETETENKALAKIYSRIVDEVLRERVDLQYFDFEIKPPFSRLMKSTLLSVKALTVEEFIKKNRYDSRL